MNICFWFEKKETQRLQQTIAQLINLYGKLTMEYYTSSLGDVSCVVDGKKLTFVPKEKIKEMSFDAIIFVGAENVREKVQEECFSLGIDDSKVIYDFEACIPAFSITKSNKLHRSKISILSINSWGNKLYQRFCIPVQSPFIDCVMSTTDWMNFLINPEEHLSRELLPDGKFTNADGVEIPVFRMGKDGLRVYMPCETDANQIPTQWRERTALINWRDILIMMYTDSPEILDRFDHLPYGKKICFTSFESNLDSAFYLPQEKDKEGRTIPLWSAVDRLAETEQPTYDLWDMLLYGRRTHLRYVSDIHA